ADIMAEWAKVGHTKIVNADKLPKDCGTLEWRNVGERRVLDILLRTTSGFIAALRDVDDPNASLFDRIVIMPPSAPPPVVTASAPPAYPRPPAPAAQAPEIPVQEPPIAQAQPADDHSDDPPQLLLGSAMPEPPSPASSSNSRHSMETVD